MKDNCTSSNEKGPNLSLKYDIGKENDYTSKLYPLESCVQGKASRTKIEMSGFVADIAFDGTSQEEHVPHDGSMISHTIKYYFNKTTIASSKFWNNEIDVLKLCQALQLSPPIKKAIKISLVRIYKISLWSLISGQIQQLTSSWTKLPGKQWTWRLSYWII